MKQYMYNTHGQFQDTTTKTQIHVHHLLPCPVDELRQKVAGQIHRVVLCVAMQSYDVFFFATCTNCRNTLPTPLPIQPFVLLLLILPCCVLNKDHGGYFSIFSHIHIHIHKPNLTPYLEQSARRPCTQAAFGMKQHLLITFTDTQYE